MFSCEFCEVSKNTFYYRTPLVAASETPDVNRLVTSGASNIKNGKVENKILNYGVYITAQEFNKQIK